MEDRPNKRRLSSKGWTKSSRSAGAGNCCVEVRLDDSGRVMIRDSKFQRDPENDPAMQPILDYTPAEWEAFIAGVKAGEFDLP